MRRVADAHCRWQAVRVEQARCAQPLTRDLLAAALSTDITHCQVWRTNWRNRVYRISLGDGTLVVAKQACVEQGGELECEFSALRRLAELPIPRLRVPQPIAYLASLQTYLMERAPGTSLDRLLWQGRTGEFVRACGLAGRILAQIHRGWSTGRTPLPVDALAADLLSIPIRFTSGQREVIRRALRVLCDQTTLVGQPYQDFKAANVLFDGNNIWLIDPPEEEAHGEPLAWDLAVFTVSLDHQWWKCVGRGSWKARAAVKRGISQFERMYRRHLPGPPIPDHAFRLFMHLVRLQRVGQLIALQKSKLEAGCRRRIPFTSAKSRLAWTLAEALPLPLLKAQAHGLLVQISRSADTEAAYNPVRGYASRSTAQH